MSFSAAGAANSALPKCLSWIKGPSPRGKESEERTERRERKGKERKGQKERERTPPPGPK